MKISVISPSFNQAQFLPDNLRTVGGQKGVDFEHIIIDPGSTDGSTEIARAASHAILVNEPDRGQSHGITKGYAMATGDIVVWLNSDDFYPSDDILAKVARAFERNPQADVIYGNVNFVDENGDFLRKGYVNKDGTGLLDSFHYQVGIVQPGVFMKKEVFEAVGGPSEDYDYCMDYEYWVRIADAGFKWVFIDEVLAHHRWWPGMKTSSGRRESLIEHFRVGLTYFGYIHHMWLDRYGEFLATNSDGVVNHASEVDEEVKFAHVRRTIERFVTQDMLAMLAKSERKEHVDTLAYIRTHAPETKRFFFNTEELKGAKTHHPDPMADQRVAWHTFDTTAKDKRTFKTYQVPDNFSRSFDSDWYHYQHARAVENLERLSRERKELCVIVANGPSLNESNFELLEYADVIISNYAIISKDLMRYATYLTMVNDLVAQQGATQFNGLDLVKIVPFWLANSLNATDSTYFVPATVAPTFNTSISGTYSWRSTVSFLNMQLAFTLGYEKVALIGFDHSYQQAPEMKEGDAVDQKAEDPNHFDPRYFQGKVWQAADTGNMEKMYLVARDAYEKAGRSIVNATVGGKLEVFPRKTLEEVVGKEALPIYPAARPADALVVKPRTLVLDMTEMGNGTATGEIKANLFKGWPADSLKQIAQQNGRNYTSVTPDGAGFKSEPILANQIAAEIDAFDPEVILFRPVAETPGLNKLALETSKRLSVPMVTWVMDDWPARLAAQDPQRWAEVEPVLLEALEKSERKLSICEAMSDAFRERYGVQFDAFANGIDPVDWPHPAPSHGEKSFIVRYAGGMAPDMNRASLRRVAEAVDMLAKDGMDIRFEISTQKWWKEKSAPLFADLRSTSIELADKSLDEYRRWIGEADLLVIAYNFDPSSLRYVQYSMANKMPECLASGAPILAHGPVKAATISYLEKHKLAQIAPIPDKMAVAEAIREIHSRPDLRNRLIAMARARASTHHNITILREEFAKVLADCAKPRSAVRSLNNVDPIASCRAELITLSAKLLLGQCDPEKLDTDPNLIEIVRKAKEALPDTDQALVQFDRVLKFKGSVAVTG